MGLSIMEVLASFEGHVGSNCQYTCPITVYTERQLREVYTAVGL